MALSEIEKLERRYAENPQGLTFAPLAEVHRKNGHVARALELLRPGLELHPNYIPASIVLGRCQLDLSDLPAAEAAFTHVLALDGENVIALKALADISERQHRLDQAERWLRTLLSVDRSNDEARAQLDRIENARRDSEAAPPRPALVPEEPTASEPTAPAMAEAAAPVPDAAAAPEPSASPLPVEPPAARVSAPEAPEVEDATPLPLADLETDFMPAPPGDEIEPLPGLVGREVDSSESGPSEFRVEQSEDIVLSSAGGHEFQVPDASLELSDGLAPPPPASAFGEETRPMFPSSTDEAPADRSPAVSELSPPEPEITRADSEPTTPVAEATPAEAAGTAAGAPVDTAWERPSTESTGSAPVAAGTGEPGSAASADQAAVAPREPDLYAEPPVVSPAPLPDVIVAPEPAPIVTETMAQVLLQQGHPTEALEVYRELEVRNAGDERLRQKIAELEEETRAVAPAPEVSPARRQYTASETGGRSVAEFFRALLAARPPMVAPAPPTARAAQPQTLAETSGAPTRPAADALSLSSVFGEETTPLPPAVPAGGTPAAGVSFDEFYGPGNQGGAAPKSRGPDPKNDDLDQFHAWLQNLKR